MGGRALKLYREILRAARRMPTQNRRTHICKVARLEFEANRDVQNPEQIQFLVQLAETQVGASLAISALKLRFNRASHCSLLLRCSSRPFMCKPTT